MIRWVFRRVKNLVCAVVALAGLIALAEVGLRTSRFLQSQKPGATTEETRPSWQIPSAVSGWEVPRAARISVTDDASQTVRWSTTPWGTRGPDPAVPKSPDVFRILCLGDEALLGTSLADSALLTYQLQTLLQGRSKTRIEVIPAALPHGCPLTLALAYRLHWSLLQPDLVLLQTSEGDIAEHRLFQQWTTCDPDGLPLACTNPLLATNQSTHWITECRQEFALVDWGFREFLKQQKKPAPQRSPRLKNSDPSKVEDIERCLAPIGLLASLTQSQRSRVIVWTCPRSSDDASIAKHRQYASSAQQVLQARQIPCIDALQSINRKAFHKSADWSAEGHRQLANFLSFQILQNLQGPWSNSSPTPDTSPQAVIPVSQQVPANGIPEIRRAIR